MMSSPQEELEWRKKKRMSELEAENEKLQEELNMLKGLLDELIDDIDSSDIGQAKKTLRRYGWG